MKNLLPIVIFVLMSINLLGQSKAQLAQPIINEFAEHFNILCEYDDNYAITIFAFIHKRNPQLEKVYVNNLLMNIASNPQSRDVLFQAYYDIALYFGHPFEEYLYAILLRLNLEESTTITIKNFIITNYDPTREKENKQEVQNSNSSEQLKVGEVNSRARNAFGGGNNNSQPTSHKLTDSEKTVYFNVIADKAYFYNEPNYSSRRSAYMVSGEHFYGSKSENGFVYTVFTNPYGISTKGWIRIVDISKEDR